MDILEIVRSPELTDESSFTSTGLSITGEVNDNLCMKAYRSLQKNHLQLPAVSVHLHKAIPMGAGLGGGSSDAAFFLQAMNEKFSIELTDEQLWEYALQLGSDCPFFLINKPCYAHGRGEMLEEIKINLSNYKIILVNPGIHINTSRAFSQLIPSKPEKQIKDIIRQPINTWKLELINDFELSVFRNYPEIEMIKKELYQYGAVYAAMSGSGSTVFGIFESGPPSMVFPGKDYFIYTC